MPFWFNTTGVTNIWSHSLVAHIYQLGISFSGFIIVMIKFQWNEPDGNSLSGFREVVRSLIDFGIWLLSFPSKGQLHQHMAETKISIVIIFIIIMFNKNVFYFYMSINELRSFLFCFLYLNIQFVLLVILCFQIHLVSLSIFSLDKFDLS